MSPPPHPLSKLEYKPLDKENEEIRVLKFLGVSSTSLSYEKIHCTIENVPLKDAVWFPSSSECPENRESPIFRDVFTECIDFRDSKLEKTEVSKAASIAQAQNVHHTLDFRYTWGDFEALSYTWGGSEDQKEINVNGVDINVPRNLEEALQALRNLEETRLGMRYWVDYLCINQSPGPHNHEKEIQVKRMRDIYSQARAVVVWLGQAEGKDELAVKAMLSLCHCPNLKEFLHLPEELLLDAGPALLAFMRKTYWTRSWIIQELAVNQNSTLILCGRFMLTRRMMRLGAIYCQRLREVYGEFGDEHDPDFDLDAWPMASRVYRLISLAFNPKTGVSLDRLLSLVRRADATLEKDKIYSIMGLLDPVISGDINPDYSESVSEQQVYTEFVVSVIKKSKSLQQIVFGGIPTSEGWPSWVPDWRKPFNRNHFQYLRCSRASGNLPAQFQFVENGEDTLLLVCDGFRVDEVDNIAGESSTNGHSIQRGKSPNRYGNQMSEALQKTLFMNHPGVTKNLLLNIPWVSKYDTSIQPANFPPESMWPKLFESNYAKRFNLFREKNGDFPIGGESLRSFFPQSGKKNANSVLTQRCLRLAVVSLEQRALITTKTGYLGLAPIDVRQGDVIAILLGVTCPVILRSYDNNLYQIVGECYIHGLMNGEILRQESKGKVVRRQFKLC